MKKILMSEFAISANNESMDDIKGKFIDEHLPLLLANEIELVRDLDHNALSTWTVNLEDIYSEAVADAAAVRGLMQGDMTALKTEVNILAIEVLGEWFDDATS